MTDDDVIRWHQTLVLTYLRMRVAALREEMSHNNGAVAMADAVLALLDEAMRSDDGPS